MKGLLVAALVVVLLAGAGGAYLLLHSPSTPGSSPTGTSQSTSSTSSSIPQIQNTPAHITVSFVACSSDKGTCVITLMNSGGTAVGATGCTMSGLSGVLASGPSSIPPRGIVNVSCAPSAGGAIPIPGFHVEGVIQFSDGSSVQFTGSWQ
jgi:hypothetical protein